MSEVELAAPIFSAIGQSMLMPDKDAVLVRFGADDGQTFNIAYGAKVVPPLILALWAHIQDLRPGVLSGEELISATRIKPKSARISVTEQGPAILFDMGGFLVGMQLEEASAREIHETLGQYLARQ